jgi:hypothetical protein
MTAAEERFEARGDNHPQRIEWGRVVGAGPFIAAS